MVTEKKPAEMEKCLARLKNLGFKIHIWHAHWPFIVNNFGKGLCRKLEELLAKEKNKLSSKTILLYCNEKDKRMSWLSPNTGRIIINIAYGLGSPQFSAEFKKVIEKSDALGKELAMTKSYF
ncbi:MAG: hypothetical protein ABIG40_02765 [Parcubacteria group bacterium]